MTEKNSLWVGPLHPAWWVACEEDGIEVYLAYFAPSAKPTTGRGA